MSDQTEPRTMQCRHIHIDGRRCGSPCVRTQDFCYYHGKARRSGPRQPQVKTLTDRKSSTFDLPSPADLAERPGVQIAIGQILHKIAHNEIDPRRAGLLLYGLQIASMNLPRLQVAKSTPALDPDDLVDEISDDTGAGPLAPEADWEDNRKKGTLERILEELQEQERLGLIRGPQRLPQPAAAETIPGTALNQSMPMHQPEMDGTAQPVDSSLANGIGQPAAQPMQPSHPLPEAVFPAAPPAPQQAAPAAPDAPAANPPHSNPSPACRALPYNSPSSPEFYDDEYGNRFGPASVFLAPSPRPRTSRYAL